MRQVRGMWFGVRRAFGLVRHLIATGVLLLALLLLDVDVGCEEAEEPAVLYGPPPSEDASGDVGADGVLPPDAQAEMPNVYYGPPPADVVEDAPPPDVQPDQPAVYYGPPPTDVVEDAPPPDGNDEELAVLYGPQPVDVVDEGQPADVVQTDCPPMVAYGPPPCDSDEDCVQWFGEGWVCDKDNSFPDGWGGTTTWPACVEKK